MIWNVYKCNRRAKVQKKLGTVRAETYEAAFSRAEFLWELEAERKELAVTQEELAFGDHDPKWRFPIPA